MRAKQRHPAKSPQLANESNAIISLVLGLALFVFPQALFALWPWQLTVLTAQAIGVGFLAVFVASVQFLRENSWGRSQIGTVSYLLIGSLQLLALARYAGTVEWSRPGTWLYVLFMAAVLCGGIYSTIAAWLPLMQRESQARSDQAG